MSTLDLQTFADAFGSSERFKHFHVVGASRLSAESVEAVLRMRFLESLTLAGCRNIPAASLVRLVDDEARLPALRELSLTHLELEPAAMSAIASTYGSQLERLDFRGCIQLNDEVANSIAEHATSLQVLQIGCARTLSEVGVSAMVRSTGATLQQLDLVACPRIGGSLVTIGECCPSLTMLDMNGSRISRAGIESLAASTSAATLRRLSLSGSSGRRAGTPEACSMLLDALRDITELDLFRVQVPTGALVKLLRAARTMWRCDVRGSRVDSRDLLSTLLYGDEAAHGSPSVAGAAGTEAGVIESTETGDAADAAVGRGGEPHAPLPALRQLLIRSVGDDGADLLKLAREAYPAAQIITE